MQGFLYHCMMFFKRFFWCVLAFGLAQGVRSQTPQLLADVIKGDKGSKVHGLTTVGNTLFYVADDDKNGMELWANDLLTQNSRLVKDICEGNCSSLPNQICAGNGLVFFTAYESDKGTELWKSDGTEKGTVRIKDINHGKTNYSPQQLTFSNGLLYFLANDGINGVEVWVSDGTEAGTHLIKDLKPGNNKEEPQHLTAVAGGVIFSINENGRQSLYFSNGQALGTKLLLAYTDFISAVYNSETRAYLLLSADKSSANALTCYAVDMSNLTVLKSDWTLRLSQSKYAGLLVQGQQNYLYLDDALYQIQSEPSKQSKGLSIEKRVSLGKGINIASVSVESNGLYLSTLQANGVEQVIYLDKTFQIKVVGKGSVFKVLADGLLMLESQSNIQLYNQLKVQDLKWQNKSIVSAAIIEIVAYKQQWYLVYKDAYYGQELFKLQEQNATYQLALYKNINQKGIGFSPQLIRGFQKDLLCFSATDDAIALWRYASDSKQFYEVKTIYLANEQLSMSDLQLDFAYVYEQKLYFTVINYASKSLELWVSDGNASGTFKLKQFVYAQPLANDQQLIGYKHLIYFNANDGISGQELWCTDGSIKGTRLFKDISPGKSSSSPQWMTVFKDELYFVADNYNNGNELWKTNGVQTLMHKDVYNGAHSSDPIGLMVHNDALYFVADDGEHGLELWCSKGESSTCALLADIAKGEEGSQLEILGGTDKYLYLSATDGMHGRELWALDLIQLKTQLIKDILPGKEDSEIAFPMVVNNVLFFFANDGNHGIELWSSQGTEKSTKLIKDIQKGSVSCIPRAVLVCNKGAYFVANIGVNQPELWCIGYNHQISAITGAYSNSNELPPMQLTFHEQLLYYVVDQYELGAEIWSLK